MNRDKLDVLPILEEHADLTASLATQPDSLDALEDQYFALKANLGRLLDACDTEDERNQVRALYVQARRNYHTALNGTLKQNEPAVNQLTADIREAQKEIEGSIKDIKRVGDVLKVVSKGVKAGVTLAKFFLPIPG